MKKTSSLTLWSLVVLALGASAWAFGPQRAALDNRPAPGELPPLPDSEISGPPTAPQRALLERDGALADRFTAQDQRVSYPFTSRAGEVSIFELAGAGYARGWSATAGLRVRDADGALLAERVVDGGVQLHPLLAFEAPAESSYVLEVSAEREYYRYALVRHSGFAPRASEPVEHDRRERVHGWLAGSDDVARYRVPLVAGEELVFKVEGTREIARQERRSMLAGQLEGAESGMGGMTMGGGRGGMQGSMRMGGRGATPLFSFPVLELPSSVDVEARGEAFARLIPSEDGAIEIGVRTPPGGHALLFDLVVQRPEPTLPVHGVIVDADDEPCAGIELLFLREPDMDPWTATTSGPEGEYQVDLPPGDYRVQLQRAGQDEQQFVRAGVTRPMELNLLLSLP